MALMFLIAGCADPAAERHPEEGDVWRGWMEGEKRGEPSPGMAQPLTLLGPKGKRRINVD